MDLYWLILIYIYIYMYQLVTMYINYHQLTLCPGDGSRSKDVEQTNTGDTERSWELRSEPPRPKFPVKNGDFI